MREPAGAVGVMDMTSTLRAYEFGDFRLDLTERVLKHREGTELPLTPRAFDTLRVLLERAGEIVDRPTLMRLVWPGLVVEDNNLDQQISLLRQALGERRGEHRYIATVPGRGYRFAAAVAAIDDAPLPKSAPMQPIEPAPAAPRDRTARALVWPIGAAAVLLVAVVATIVVGGRETPPATPIASTTPTLAVLPFKPVSAADRNESLELGMAETLIAGLNSDRLQVRPLSSVRRFAGVEHDALAAGRELGADVVLEGYLQRSDDAVRVSTRLLNVADGRQLWAQRYDEPFSDILSIQDSIAARVIDALAPNLAGAASPLRRYTDDVEAYQLYLDGQFYRLRVSEAALNEALARFLAAIDRDPNFALAYVGAAECYAIFGVFGIRAPHDTFPQARAAVDKALELAPDLGEAYASLGHIKTQYEMDWAGAERAYRRALELNPGYAPTHQWLGLLLGYQGHLDQALAELQVAQALEPAAPIYAALIGMILGYQGDHDAAIEQLERVVTMAPDLPPARTFLTMAYLRRGDFDKAAEQAAAMTSPAPGSMGYVGQIYALTGRRAEALAEAERLVALASERYVPAYDIASIYATLGDADEALMWLARAFEERGQLLGFLPRDGAFDAVRTDPRYVALVAALPGVAR